MKFLMALRRFISRRGKPEEFILDNASQFKTTKKVIDLSWNDVVEDKEVYSYVSMNNIKWVFITEFAPWEGGFYVRLIGLVKASIRKTVGCILLSKEQLSTFITETEAVINSRPMVYVNDDISSSNVITPGHFLNMIWSTGTPDINQVSGADDFYRINNSNTAKRLLEFWKRGQRHLDTFWNSWKNDYLLSLRERYEKCLKSPRIISNISPVEGQIVHVKDKMPTGTWKIAKIQDLIISRDGKIRSAKVRFPSGVIITRPLNLLYPMETAIPNENQAGDEKVDDGELTEDAIAVEQITESPPKMRRTAGLIARKKLSKLLLNESLDS